MIFDWNEHYKNGGVSGEPEDYNISRDWKKNIILKYCDLDNDSVIDIGCGDLQFWNNKLPKNYTGVDISSVIIEKNKQKYPNKLFITSNAVCTLNIHSTMVCCFDMLWHILDDDDYIKILSNIKKYANTYIIIYTWNKNIFDNRSFFTKMYIALVNLKHGKTPLFESCDGDGEYQKYRDFLKISIPLFSPEFKLIGSYTNDYWKFGTMYVFKRWHLFI